MRNQTRTKRVVKEPRLGRLRAQSPVGPEISLGQFVKQLAATLSQKSVVLPFKDQKRWHLLFHELAKLPTKPGKPKFLSRLIFDWDASYPKCQELADFLHALHFTASVSAHNPRYDVISLDPTDAKRWVAQINHDDPNVRHFLNRAINLARQEFKAAPSA